MTYDETEGAQVTRAQVIAELAHHYVTDLADFYRECGDAETYDARQVLDWLGY